MVYLLEVCGLIHSKIATEVIVRENCNLCDLNFDPDLDLLFGHCFYQWQLLLWSYHGQTMTGTLPQRRTYILEDARKMVFIELFDRI